jgi:hypothetical protein
MRPCALTLWVLLVAGGGAGRALAAIPETTPQQARAARVVAEAKASQPLSSRVLSPPLPLQEVLDAWPRQLRERTNAADARMEELDRRTYEIVGRLQLLVGFLIIVLLGVFVWLLELSRRLALLETDRGPAQRANAPSRRVG